jgi:hypothetical protein
LKRAQPFRFSLCGSLYSLKASIVKRALPIEPIGRRDVRNRP